MVDADVRVVQQVAAIGRLDEFNPANDSITAYVERAQLYMEANSVPEDKKVAVFLSAIGRKTYSLLRNLLTPTLPKEKTFEQIVTVLKNHFEPKPLEIVESVSTSIGNSRDPRRQLLNMWRSYVNYQPTATMERSLTLRSVIVSFAVSRARRLKRNC